MHGAAQCAVCANDEGVFRHANRYDTKESEHALEGLLQGRNHYRLSRAVYCSHCLHRHIC